jgi:predicted dinucleotide-binding enzyme
MEDTTDYASAPTMFVAGDDTPRKAIVLNLVADLGFAAVDAGPLSVSRLLEPYAMLWIHLATSSRAPANAAFVLQLKQEIEA